MTGLRGDLVVLVVQARAALAGRLLKTCVLCVFDTSYPCGASFRGQHGCPHPLLPARSRHESGPCPCQNSLATNPSLACPSLMRVLRRCSDPWLRWQAVFSTACKAFAAWHARIKCETSGGRLSPDPAFGGRRMQPSSFAFRRGGKRRRLRLLLAALRGRRLNQITIDSASRRLNILLKRLRLRSRRMSAIEARDLALCAGRERAIPGPYIDPTMQTSHRRINNVSLAAAVSRGA